MNAVPVTVHRGDELSITHIRRSRNWMPVSLRDLRVYRELMYFLAWRDIKVRYKQTVLGGTWAVIQPLLTMAVFTIFLGRLAGVPSDGVPYSLFAYVALVPWTFFSTTLTQASTSLVDQSRLITKVYFPRLLVPAALVAAGLVDFAIAFSVLIGMLVWYHVTPPVWIVVVPMLVLLTALTALGVGLWAAALNVRYRDVRHVMPFVVQFWLFVTPVAYPASLVPERWRALYAANPMAGIISGFRWAIVGIDAPVSELIVSTIACIVILAGGLMYFARTERSFADVL